MKKIYSIIIITIAITTINKAISQTSKVHLTIEQIFKTHDTFSKENVEKPYLNDQRFYKQMDENAGYNSDLIIKGKVLYQRTFIGNHKPTMMSGVFTAYFIEVQEVLKGKTNSKIVVSYNRGGSYGEIGSDIGSHEFYPYRVMNLDGYYCFKTSPLIVNETKNDTLKQVQFFDCISSKSIIDATNKIVETVEVCKHWDIPYTQPKTIKKKANEETPVNQNIENKKRFDKCQQSFKQRLLSAIQIQPQQSNSTNPEDCKKAFFSEFDNGIGFNKALEIFNPQNNPLDLTGYTVKAYLNGQTLPITINLSGIISPKGTHVITTVDADPNIVSIANEIVSNADLINALAIVLYDNNSNPIDKIGSTQIADWANVNLTDFANHNFKRKFNIGKGEINWILGQQEWDMIPQNDFSNIHNHLNVCNPAANNIDYTIANTVITSNGNDEFVEFDIMATAPSGTYISNTPFTIKYNTNTFGSNVVANGNINVSLGATFGPSYTNPQSVINDSAADKFETLISDDFNATSWNRPYVSTTPVQVLHFRMKIINCNTSNDFYFTNYVAANIVSLGVPTATENFINGAYYFYDNVAFHGYYNFNVPSCAPYISQINGSSNDVHCIGGDINDPASTLTIQGTRFGAVQGTGRVFMKNADNGGATEIQLDNSDIINWSNNTITIKVPSKSTTYPSIPFVAGSGTITVVTNAGFILYSPQSVIVDYSFTNYNTNGNTNPTHKDRPVLASKANENHRRYYKINTATNAIPGLRDCVKKAIKDWRCSTAVNWYLDDNTTSADNSGPDSVSVISFKNYTNNQNILMTTRAHQSTCVPDAMYSNDADILINTFNQNNFIYDTTFTDTIPLGKFDFYNTILHELGHAMLLEHTNQASDIMYFGTTTGPILPIDRINYIDFHNLDAGQSVVVKSNNTLNIPCSNTETMYYETTGNCTNTSGERRILANQKNTLNVYPNPTNDFINISYILLQNSNTKIQFINSIGQIVKEYASQQQAGEQTISFDTKPYSKGIYYIKYDDGINTKNAKVVLQ